MNTNKWPLCLQAALTDDNYETRKANLEIAAQMIAERDEVIAKLPRDWATQEVLAELIQEQFDTEHCRQGEREEGCPGCELIPFVDWLKEQAKQRKEGAK